MQPIKTLTRALERLASPEQYFFALDDLRGALPEAGPGALEAILSRSSRRCAWRWTWWVNSARRCLGKHMAH